MNLVVEMGNKFQFMEQKLHQYNVDLLSDIELSETNGGIPIWAPLGILVAVWGYCYNMGKDGKSADSYHGK